MSEEIAFKPNNALEQSTVPYPIVGSSAALPMNPKPYYKRVIVPEEEPVYDKDDGEWSPSEDLPNYVIAIHEFHSSKFETKFGKSASKSLNAIQLMPPGWKRSIYVPFLAGKLPVCQDCKVYTLTRDVCRLSKGHEGLPWSTSWVCILTDSTVRKENDKGQEEFVDGNYNVKQHQPRGVGRCCSSASASVCCAKPD
ncbi:hypothetical protein TrLO_g7589 [Triparma laevis f. longispina]|uniref:Uncharacterized protein n=1 Tax=Triparma laevis f. longispina TaxID=1714387 RepID=A0A9W7F8Q3_9STRA|nr:hypothetical protein TrLO_g7589 [Triparma laevis f. longispina]